MGVWGDSKCKDLTSHIPMPLLRVGKWKQLGWTPQQFHNFTIPQFHKLTSARTTCQQQQQQQLLCIIGGHFSVMQMTVVLRNKLNWSSQLKGYVRVAFWVTESACHYSSTDRHTLKSVNAIYGYCRDFIITHRVVFTGSKQFMLHLRVHLTNKATMV